VLAVPILAWILLEDMPQSAALFRAWPNATAISAQMPALLARHPGTYLTSTDLYQVLGYYDDGRAHWSQWDSDLHFSIPGKAPGPASDWFAIQSHYFSLIIIDTRRNTITGADESVIADLSRAGGYHLVASTGEFKAWSSVEGS
jgi:hypothetical protein